MQSTLTLRRLFYVTFGLLLAALTINGCKKSSSSSDEPASDLAAACVQDGQGTWAAGSSTCTCASGWILDTASGRCNVVDTAAQASAGCAASGGTWADSACTCQSNYTWTAASNSCVANATTSTSATVVATEAQCTNASGTGAVWNGSVCLCQSATYPYWDSSALQCTLTTQTSAAVAGSVTETQCGNAAATGAVWNGSACQCTTSTLPSWSASGLQCVAAVDTSTSAPGVTQAQCTAAASTGAVWTGSACGCQSASYPFWNPSYLQCTASNSTGGINGQGPCAFGQLYVNDLCYDLATLSPAMSCPATGGTWNASSATCACGGGYSWYSALNSCQNLQGTGVSGSIGQQICTSSGGAVGSVGGACSCPASMVTAYDQSGGFLYCSPAGGGALSWLRRILGIFF